MMEGTDHRAASLEPDSWIDVIYHNMMSTSNFRTFRTSRADTGIKEWIQRLARQIEVGCFDEVISVAASKHTFVVVVSTTVSKEELVEKGWPA